VASRQRSAAWTFEGTPTDTTPAASQPAASLNVDVNNLVISPAGGGGPGEVVTITATYRDYFAMAPIIRFIANGYVDFTVSTVMMNEPAF
jgi:hypothetical protein